jgi:hypothetical protein
VGLTLQIAIRAVHVKSPVEFHSQKPDTGVVGPVWPSAVRF